MAGLTIGDVAARTGLAVSAIRYYEEMGLVRPDRNAGGQRRFVATDIRRLSFVMVTQKLGFSIAEIGEHMASLPGDRAPTKADWTRMSRTFRKRIDGRIAELETLRDRLDACIGCGCLSLRQCHLYNRSDEASEKGSGPRYLLGDHPKNEP